MSSGTPYDVFLPNALWIETVVKLQKKKKFSFQNEFGYCCEGAVRNDKQNTFYCMIFLSIYVVFSEENLARKAKDRMVVIEQLMIRYGMIAA